MALEEKNSMENFRLVSETKDTIMPRGRKTKNVKTPTRLERLEKFRARIVGLPEELVSAGFGNLVKPPGPIQLTEPEPDKDPKTEGFIGKVKEPLGAYLQRVSILENFAQRPPFDHVNDSIYRRLIRDFIQGAAMPESKVAALSRTAKDSKSESLNDSDTWFSVIDGLQRLYCFAIAVLLVLRREQLIADGLITQDAWDYFGEAVQGAGDNQIATEELLRRIVRYEIFYNIDLAGLLHYMVTFNTGQRRMSLPVQLEIMQRPLVDELEKRAKIPVFRDMEKIPGRTKPKEQFAASELVLAAQAFITHNAQVTASNEAERFLNEDQAYLDNVGDITDVVKTLKRIATELHPRVMQVYAADANKRYILSSQLTFLIGLSAACGYYRNRLNMKSLESSLDKLQAELERPVEDPLELDEYAKALTTITASRGKSTRRLVYDTFVRFFSGATMDLEWLDTARQITGSVD
jgi:hypothetical protein